SRLQQSPIRTLCRAGKAPRRSPHAPRGARQHEGSAGTVIVMFRKRPIDLVLAALLAVSMQLTPSAVPAAARGRKLAAPLRPDSGITRSAIVPTRASDDAGDDEPEPRKDDPSKSRRQAALEPEVESTALEGLAREAVVPPADEERLIDLP